jgi:ribosomal protein L40E
VLDEKLAKDGKPSGEKTELEKKMDMSLDMLEGIKKGKAARKLEEGEGEKTKVCAKCGNENPLGNKFCEDCGNGFEKVEEKNPEKVVPVAKETGNIQEKLKEASIDTAEISIGKDRKVGVSSREYERLRTLLGLGNDDLNKFIENNQKIKDFQAIIDKNKKE